MAAQWIIILGLVSATLAKPYKNKFNGPDPEFFGKNGDIDGDVDYTMDPLNAIVNKARCWPGGVLHYTLRNGDFGTEAINNISRGIQDLIESTKVNGVKCIDIHERTTQTAYVEVYAGSGCSSSIGRTGSRQLLSLYQTCVQRHGTIMHEFLHAFGFYHEQSRTDRDDWVIINWDNIQAGYENNFRKYEENEIDLAGTLYDYGSVMHYPPYGFAIDPEVPTIFTIDEDAMDIIGQRVKLSDLDIERVQIVYGCITPAESKYHQHLVGREGLFTTCADA